MDDSMREFLEKLVDLENEGEQLLLARHQLIENDRLRNGNREALTALRKRACTTKTSVPAPFESLMKEVLVGGRKPISPLLKELCSTCGDYNSEERICMTFPGTDTFARLPFHAAHSLLEADQEHLDNDAKILQSFVKDKSLAISEKGALADKISPGVLRSLVTLTDKRLLELCFPLIPSQFRAIMVLMHKPTTASNLRNEGGFEDVKKAIEKLGLRHKNKLLLMVKGMSIDSLDDERQLKSILSNG